MSEFVGRTGSSRVYSYPETNRGGSAQSGSNNFATAPELEIEIPLPNMIVEWDQISSGAPSSEDVPITLTSSGVIRIAGVICAKHTAGADAAGLQIQVRIDGVSLVRPTLLKSTCMVDGFIAIPFLAETEALSLGLHTVSILLTPTIDLVLSLAQASSSIEIREVVAATG